jgi:general bacterial porin, GBP family
MKKTLLAAALLTGFAGAASAQSSVTLYGVVDMGLNYQTIKPGAAATAASGTATRGQFGMASGQQAGSRWGLRGNEDLGNGLSANFVYEQGVTANTGATQGAGFQRQSTLGLRSTSWGALDLGRRTAPSTQAFFGIDPFAAGFGTAALTSTIGTNFYRLSNMVMYSTPSMSGFQAMIGYSFDTGLSGTPAASTASTFGQSTKSRAVSLGLRYANGPLLLAGTYDNIQANSRSTPTYLQAGTSYKTWALGGTYDFKVVKVHAAYSQAVDGILNNTTTINSVATGGDTNSPSAIIFRQGARTQSWMFGLSAPVGTGSVFASVQQQLPGGNLKDLQTGNELGASIGYTYPFSKRTNMYVSYSYVNNAAMISSATANTVSLGIRHLF